MNHQAIRNIYPQVVTIDDGTGAFDKDGSRVVIDQSLVAAEAQRIQAEYEAKQYQRDRAKEYPSFAEQFDLLYHGGYDAWKASIQSVKDKYPKGSA